MAPEEIVCEDYEILVDRALKLAQQPGSRKVLGIAGPPGTGKSTLAEYIFDAVREHNEISVCLLPMDGFHYYNSILIERGIRNVKGAPHTFDVDAFVELLNNVRIFEDQDWYAPGFDRSIEEPVANQHFIPAKTQLVITEGNYLLMHNNGWEKVRPLLDEAWFIPVDRTIERQRLVERQLAGNKTKEDAIDWVDRSDLSNADLVNETAQYADLVIKQKENFSA